LTIRGSRRVWLYWGIGLAWFYLLLWPLTGIKGGELGFGRSLDILALVAGVSFVGLVFHQSRQRGVFASVERPVARFCRTVAGKAECLPPWFGIGLVLVFAASFPLFTERYAQDVAINVLIYICLGLGLNVVVGLAGLLDLGYIAFYGVGAYTYALLNLHLGLSFWLSLPLAGCFAAVAGCIIGYPTLRMRGDYLAIVTLGFGEIVRIVLNNWMDLTNGPNGIQGIAPPSVTYPVLAAGLQFETMQLKKLSALYYVVLGLAVVTVIAVHRLNFSRIGRAWEAIREDETAAELMGVDTFRLKLLAYGAGAVFGGLAGAFFAARMRSVSPSSFTFIESAMVLSMVVLGGMGSIPGIVLGALALVALPEVFREFELYRMLAFGGAMTVMMLFRPKGLWPAKRVGVRSEDRE
jgi:branched-chain amino acid transport system permease protein